MPISFPWASNLIYIAVGETPPQQGGGAGGGVRGAAPGPASRGEGAARRPPQPIRLANLDQFFRRAERQVADWRSINLRLPTAVDAPLLFAIDQGNGGQPQRRSTLVLDAATGDVERWDTFEGQSLGRRLRSWSRFTHTGEAFGFWGQTIAGVASAGGIVRVYTGLALAWRRFFGKKASTAASPRQEAA